jgi:hypothetical protein
LSVLSGGRKRLQQSKEDAAGRVLRLALDSNNAGATLLRRLEEDLKSAYGNADDYLRSH